MWFVPCWIVLIHCIVCRAYLPVYGNSGSMGPLWSAAGCRVILPIIISRSMPPRNFQRWKKYEIRHKLSKTKMVKNKKKGKIWNTKSLLPCSPYQGNNKSMATKNIFNSSNSSPLYQNQLRCDVNFNAKVAQIWETWKTLALLPRLPMLQWTVVLVGRCWDPGVLSYQRYCWSASDDGRGHNSL